MWALLLGAIAVPLVDLAVKWLGRERLARTPVRLGLLGELRLVESRAWIARVAGPLPIVPMLAVWLAASGVLAIGTLVAGLSGWPAGLLVGGSLGHALESALRGRVDDYVCLRFWPAFDLADVALAAGAVGMLADVVLAVSR